MRKACLLVTPQPCRKAYRRAVNLTRIMPPPRAQRGAAAHVWGRAGRGALPLMARRARPCSAALGVADMSFFWRPRLKKRWRRV